MPCCLVETSWASRLFRAFSRASRRLAPLCGRLAPTEGPAATSSFKRSKGSPTYGIICCDKGQASLEKGKDATGGECLPLAYLPSYPWQGVNLVSLNLMGHVAGGSKDDRGAGRA
jgi:hypothetical protein